MIAFHNRRINMARLIQAFTAFGPKIDLTDAAEPQRFMELITQRTTLSAGVVKNVQESEVETLIGLLKEGRPVHTGVAIFRPSIDLEGKISISVRVDKRILSALNAPGAFTGNIKNHENVGKSTQEIVEMWNTSHPADPIVLETEPESQP
jgi:hypothetical protein